MVRTCSAVWRRRRRAVIFSVGSTTCSVKVYQDSPAGTGTTLSAIIKRRKGVTGYVAPITLHCY